MSHLHHKVSALVDGELQGSARRRALAHIRVCADCQRDVEETLVIKRRLLGLRASEPSGDLFASLDAASRAHQGPSDHGARPARRLVTARRLLTGAGSVSLAVLSIAYVVGAPAEVSTVAAPPRVDDFTAEFATSAGVEPLADPSVGALSLDPQPATPDQAVGLGAEATPLAPVDVRVPPGDSTAAIRLLEAAVAAPAVFAFAGTRRIAAYDGTGPGAIDVDVLHVPAQGTRFQVDAGTGGASSAVFVDADADAAAAAGPSTADLLRESYDVAVVGHDTVAGRRAAVVGVARDGELAAQLWIDTATGVLLRRDVYAGGRLARSSEFLDFRLRPHAFLDHVPPTLVQPDLRALSTTRAAQFNDSGWTCPATVVSGWQLTELDQVDSGSDTLHAEYSDGLTSVSIYEQRGALDPADLAGFERVDAGSGVVYRRDGLPTQVVWQSGDMVYTVITDAPAATVDDLLSGLPTGTPEADDPGFGSRVGAGLDKMVGFLSPVG